MTDMVIAACLNCCETHAAAAYEFKCLRLIWCGVQLEVVNMHRLSLNRRVVFSVSAHARAYLFSKASPSVSGLLHIFDFV